MPNAAPQTSRRSPGTTTRRAAVIIVSVKEAANSMSVVAPRAKANAATVVGKRTSTTAAVVAPYRRHPSQPSAREVSSALRAEGSRAADSLSPTSRYDEAAAQ